MRQVELMLQESELRYREEAQELRSQQLRLEQLQRESTERRLAPPLRPLPRPPEFFADTSQQQLQLRRHRESLQQELCQLLAEFSQLRNEQEILCQGGVPFMETYSRLRCNEPFRLFPPPQPVLLEEPGSLSSTSSERPWRRSSRDRDDRHERRESNLEVQSCVPLSGFKDRESDGGQCSSSTVTGLKSGLEAFSPSPTRSSVQHAYELQEPREDAKELPEEPPLDSDSPADVPITEAESCGELLHLLAAKHLKVQCSDADLGPEQAPALAAALQHAPIEALILSSNELGPEGIEILAPALASCSNLRHLDLSWNQLGVSGAQVAAGALPKLRLRHLELGSNQLEASGAIALAQALAKDTSILDLDLSWNSIGDEGGIAMAGMLRKNRSLRRLNLAINNLTSATAEAFRKLQGHPSLKEVDLAGNEISDEQMPRF